MHCAGAAFASGAVKRGFDMMMLTSDLSCMVAGARMQLDELKAKTSGLRPQETSKAIRR